MGAKDILSYAQHNWSTCKDSAQILSSSKKEKSETALVKSEVELYDFDKICKEIFPNSRVTPTSVDGLAIRGRHVQLIEFKKGFKDIISTENFNEELAACEHIKAPCQRYWTEFKARRESERDELMASLRAKAIESFVTLDQSVFPYCKEISGKPLCVDLIIVIDAPEIDSMEEILAEAAKKPLEDDNVYQKIEKALSRYKRQQDKERHIYYYNDIKVISAQEFDKSDKYGNI